MASFDDKVAALRKLQERRQARDERPRQEHRQDSEGQELTNVLEHYAGFQELPNKEPSPCEETGEAGAAASAQEATKNSQDDEGDALYCLGHCFEKGIHDCGQDLEKAAYYYSLAASKGSTFGQWRLGHLHEYGQGVEASDAKAANWYRFAAESGHPHAQSSLALLLEDGRASALYDSEAVDWHLAAAKQGNVLSQYCAACCLAEGRGVERDESAAKALLEKSAAAGFPMAVEALEQGTLWNHTGAHETTAQDTLESCFRDAEKTSEGSLLDIAVKMARKIEHLQDGEAEAFLDELLNSLDDPAGFGTQEVEAMLAAGELDLGGADAESMPEPTPWAVQAQSAAAA